MKKQRKQIDIFNLSFLDVISCGFGAIILLLVLSEVSEPLVRENEQTDLLQESVQLQEEIEQRRVDIDEKDKSLQQQKEDLLALQTQTLQLEKKLAAIEKKRSEVMTGDRATSKIEQQLLAARQQLNEEMRRLQEIPVRKAMDSPIGGVPVDSEYIIFIIDTSGSMQRYA